MTTNISDLVIAIVSENPHMTNQQVAEVVRQKTGSTTSPASVSSIKSNARKAGKLEAAKPQDVDISDINLSFAVEELEPETEEERSDRIRRRFDTLERMSHKVANGQLPAIIVSGPPGLGKSYTVEKVLQDKFGDPISPEDPDFDGDLPTYDTICGTITPPGLIIALWNMRNGGVVVLDDCDDVFRDETCLNILKAVLDSSDRRIVSYRKQAHWMAEYGIPQSFEFKGSVVFCTNIDFEAAIAKKSPMAPHFEALIDRSLYLSLTMRTTDDFMARIHQVAIEEGLLKSKGLNDDEAQEIYDFVDDNRDQFYGLSLRLVGQIAFCYTSDNDTWKDDVTATKMRTFRRR